jgi:hypothetical protein
MRTIDQQTLKGMRHNLGASSSTECGAFSLDHRNTVFKRKQRAFVAIDSNANDQTIHKQSRPVDNIKMAQSNRVEGSRV